MCCNAFPVCTFCPTEEMYQAIQKLIEEIKDEAYGRRTITVKRREREKNEALLMKRKEEIKQAIKRMDEEGKRINEKIFLTRNQLDMNDDYLVHFHQLLLLKQGIRVLYQTQSL